MKTEALVTPFKDLMDKALKDYDEASKLIHHFNSDIPKAIIKFYTDKIQPVEPEEEPPKYPTSWRDFTMTDKIEPAEEITIESGNDKFHLERNATNCISISLETIGWPSFILEYKDVESLINFLKSCVQNQLPEGSVTDIRRQFKENI